MKLVYDEIDYEYAVSEYGDLELTFHEYWKHGFYYKNVETGITVLFHSNDIYRIPLKLNETINDTTIYTTVKIVMITTLILVLIASKGILKTVV